MLVGSSLNATEVETLIHEKIKHANERINDLQYKLDHIEQDEKDLQRKIERRKRELEQLQNRLSKLEVGCRCYTINSG